MSNRRTAAGQGRAQPTAPSHPSACSLEKSAWPSGRPLGSETCVSVWRCDLLCAHLFLRRKNETGFSIETLCHDPSKSLYGMMLDDFNSSVCMMKEKNTTGGMVQVCSCTEEECNNFLIFSPSECRNPLAILLWVKSLSHFSRACWQTHMRIVT